MVLERSVPHRLQVAANCDRRAHIDILDHARRRWKNGCRTVGCKRSCGMFAGGLAQSIFWTTPSRLRVQKNYVRTGFEREIEVVLDHDALDFDDTARSCASVGDVEPRMHYKVQNSAESRYSAGVA